MATTVYRPCYATREQVKRALDVKQASYDDVRVDRAIMAASDAVEAICQRIFYINDTTKQFDWPNYQYSYPWRLWLDQNELAAPPTLVTTGSLLPVPVVIPVSAIICQPVNNGPPFTSIELRRDLDFAFGYNTTPQLDIAITGTFGYWMNTVQAGSLAAPMLAGDTTLTASDSVSIGVGDLVFCDSERMVVTDSAYTNTGVSFSGLSTASAADNQVGVPNGALFSAGETLLVDSEWLLVLSVIGNTLNVKRAWDASVVAAHTGGTLWARRLYSVLRGQLGTISVGHASAEGLTTMAIPGLVRETAIAEAEVWLTQEPTAYGGGAIQPRTRAATRTGGQVNEAVPGTGLPDLRDRLANSIYCRKARSRVI
jgi:hypothetical protein